MKINCITIDDEPLALQQMEDFISKIEYLNLIGKFKNGIEPLNFLKNNQVDLMFLDIHMESFNGIQLLESLSNKPKVILTTAYDSYALKGYELDVTDYLLKPISFKRFVQAVEKVFKVIQLEKQPASRNKEKKTVLEENTSDKFAFIKCGNKLEKVVFDDILYIEGMREYLKIHTKTKKLITLTSFSKLEEILPQSDFIRIHKSYIISISKIESIEKNRIKISENFIPISSTYKQSFFKFIENKNFS